LYGWSNVHKAGTQFDSEPLMDKGIGLVGFRRLTKSKERQLEIVPDYLNDLNAMHEAEQYPTLNETDGSRGRYVYNLSRCSGAEAIFSTAAQRAEAFALTMEPE